MSLFLTVVKLLPLKFWVPLKYKRGKGFSEEVAIIFIHRSPSNIANTKWHLHTIENI